MALRAVCRSILYSGVRVLVAVCGHRNAGLRVLTFTNRRMGGLRVREGIKMWCIGEEARKGRNATRRGQSKATRFLALLHSSALPYMHWGIYLAVLPYLIAGYSGEEVELLYIAALPAA